MTTVTPTPGPDDAVHQRARLGILTIAHEARRVEAGYLRTRLDLTAGNLSEHLRVLEEATLIAVEKGGRIWITLTPAGHDALTREIHRLQQLITRVEDR